MGGLQDSKLTPFLVGKKKKKIWNVAKTFKPQNSPSLQIHFDGNSHWVCSFSPENQVLYYLDSLGEQLKISK